MVLDECPKLTREKKILSKSIEISTSWAKRCKIEFGNSNTKALFGIAQGGLDKDLRAESIQKLIDTKTSQKIWLNATGVNSDNQVVSTFSFEWTLLLKD